MLAGADSERHVVEQNERVLGDGDVAELDERRAIGQVVVGRDWAAPACAWRARLPARARVHDPVLLYLNDVADSRWQIVGLRGGQHHAGALRVQGVQDLQQIPAAVGIQAREGLVDQKQPGIQHQRAGEQQPAMGWDELAEHFGITAPFIAEAAKRAIARKRGLQ